MNEELERYQVLLTADALKDIDDIYDYIVCKLKAPMTAQKLCGQIRGAILDLQVFPQRYKVMEAFKEESRKFRGMPIGNYLIIYVIIAQTVMVTNILHSTEDINQKLKL